MLKFEVQDETRSIIKVIGVGGGGSNAVNHMFRQGIQGVEFIVCNTDYQDLQKSPVINKIQLGNNLTKGLGAGAKPEMGRDGAIEAIDEIRRQLSDGTQMVFITAGLGGGTGTGAAPVIASVARELGILTVGIVTMPFTIEGKKRCMQAAAGLEEMKKYVDTLLVIGNDKLREIYGNQKLSEAFVQADNVLLSAAKAIAEIISINLHINVDFNDVKTVMKDSGVAIMGSAACSGEHRALRAVENALNSPLLNDNNIRGARHVLLNIMSGSDDITMDEFGEITDYIQEESGYTAELITGYGIDSSLGDNVSVTIIATGFNQNHTGFEAAKETEKVISVLTDEKSVVTEKPIVVEKPILNETKKAEEPFIILKNEEAKPLVQETEDEKKSESTSTEIFLTNATIPSEITPTMKIQETSQSSELENKTEITQNKVEETKEPVFTITSTTSEINPPVITEVTAKTEEIKPVIAEKKEISDFNNAVDKFLNQGTSQQLHELEEDERVRLAKERIKRLKELSLKIKTPEGLTSLEKEPSFKRKNTQLDDTTNYSTESNVSRYTLSDGDGKTEIKPNNSFLHDNVD